MAEDGGEEARLGLDVHRERRVAPQERDVGREARQLLHRRVEEAGAPELSDREQLQGERKRTHMRASQTLTTCAHTQTHTNTHTHTLVTDTQTQTHTHTHTHTHTNSMIFFICQRDLAWVTHTHTAELTPQTNWTHKIYVH